MRYRGIPGTDLLVSELSLGTMQFGWTADEKDAQIVLDEFYNAGGNFIDTSDNYSQWAHGNPGGVAERIIGRWLAHRGTRDDIIIATKVGKRMWPGKDGAGLGYDHIIRACEASLDRLGTDYIDLYLCHLDDTETPLSESLGALAQLVDSGKVRYIGCSNYTPERLEEALCVSAAARVPRFSVIETLYNILRRAVVDGLRPFLSEHKVGLFAYNTLAAGFLTGKYSKYGCTPYSARKRQVRRRYCRPADFAALEVLMQVSRGRGLTVSQLSLQWVLSDPVVTSAIVGVNNRIQLSEALVACSDILSKEDWAVLIAKISQSAVDRAYHS